MASNDSSARAESVDMPLDQIGQIAGKLRDLVKDGRSFTKKKEEILEQIALFESVCVKQQNRIVELELIVNNQSTDKPLTTTIDPISGSFGRSFADACRSNPVKPPIQSKHVIRVYPKAATDSQSGSPRASSETTKQILFKKVPLKGLNVGVRVKSTNRGGVVVECRNKEEMSAISKAINDADTDLTVKESKKVNPTFTMLLPGVDYDLDEVKEDILTKNAFLPKEPDALKLVHKWNTKNGNTVVVIEVSPPTYQILAKHEFTIYQGWIGMRKLRERDPVSQCFRCNRFGHKTLHCRFQVNGNSVSRCAQCGDHHEGVNRCEASPQCSNCLEYNTIAEKRNWKKVDPNHNARDKSCPCRIAAITKAKQQNVDYGY